MQLPDHSWIIDEFLVQRASETATWLITPMRIHRSIFVFIILMAISMTAPSQGRAALAAAEEKAKPLAEFLAGTRWFWEGSKDHVLEFREDGTVRLDYWTLPTDWRVTGSRQVTFTMHFKNQNKTAIVTFTDDRSSFSGIQFNKRGVIAKSPRASRDEGENPEPAAK